MDERKNYNDDVSIANVFIECMPFPWQCLKPNRQDYQNDERIKRLEEEIGDRNTYICIIGKDNDVSALYKEMILLGDELNSKWLQEDEVISIVDYKKIFWLEDMRSCKIFLDVYRSEDNPLIIEQYNRIFESVAGNNLCISLNDFRGMICRLPYDMSVYAKIGTKGGKDFL